MTQKEFEKKKQALIKRARELNYQEDHIREIVYNAEELLADGAPDVMIDEFLNPSELVEQPPYFPGMLNK